MKIAVPSIEGELAQHFGHCRSFCIFEVKDGKIAGSETAEPPPHEPGILPKWLADQGVEVVIAGGMGHRAQTFFTQYGISVLVGTAAAPVEKIVRDYLDGVLVTGQNACDH